MYTKGDGNPTYPLSCVYFMSLTHIADEENFINHTNCTDPAVSFCFFPEKTCHKG